MNSIPGSTGPGTGALTRLCGLDEVDEDEPFRAEIDGLGYAVFRVGEMIFVTSDLCTHGPGLLSEGHVEDFQVVCPFHQGAFDIRTGEATRAPCEHPIRIWAPVIVDGGIYIDPASPR